MIGALAGINMISGAGMLDFLACFSPEKLVIDAEAIRMAQRMAAGVQAHTETLATAMFEGIHFKGEFLKQRVTRQLFSKEQAIPSAVIDRNSIRGWQADGRLDTFGRAKAQAAGLLAAYRQPDLPEDQLADLQAMMQSLAAAAGMDRLPPLD
jgi:trimethylamine--corrinoid protein Co-methyltransferase